METSAQSTAVPVINVEKVVSDILATIDREREREIISRRFGLFDRKETLEQIGELLGITRERVRQLEKAVMVRLQMAASKELPHMSDIEEALTHHIKELGNIARIKDLTAKLTTDNTKIDQSRVAFLSQLVDCLLYTSPSPRDRTRSRMPSSA